MELLFKLTVIEKAKVTLLVLKTNTNEIKATKRKKKPTDQTKIPKKPPKVKGNPLQAMIVKGLILHLCSGQTPCPSTEAVPFQVMCSLALREQYVSSALHERGKNIPPRAPTLAV